MIWIKLENHIPEVTRTYLETIGEAFIRKGEKVTYVEEFKEIRKKKGDLVVVSHAIAAFEARRRGLRYLYWAQGIWPEESFLKHQNGVRFLTASWLEKEALKKAAFCLFVSGTMKAFYEKKYHLRFSHSYIMPCLNDTLHREAFFTPGKYENNVFCYIGSTAVWQCFEETLRLYKSIEEADGRAELVLLVKDQAYAKRLVEQYGIQNCVIDYVPVEELGRYLSRVKYGFVIRENHVVNAVATPTKIETYLCYGILPVYSSSLRAIRRILSDERFTIPYTGERDRITASMKETVNAGEVFRSFECIYNKAYERNRHIKRLAGRLGTVL